YNAVLRNREPADPFADLVRGLMQPDPEARWDHEQIKGWLEGKRQNVAAIVQRAEAIRPFEFRDQQSITRRDLAHLFYLDWEHIPEALQHSHLLHWVSVSLRNKELAEQIARISRSVMDLSARNEQQLNELLM